jgi:hypothetical protein
MRCCNSTRGTVANRRRLGPARRRLCARPVAPPPNVISDKLPTVGLPWTQMRRRQADGRHGGEMARLAWCRKDPAGLRERKWCRIEELKAASAQRRRRRWFAAPAATWDAAERSLLGAQCGHETRADRVTPSVRSDHDLGPIAARDRDCCRTDAVKRLARSGVAGPSPKQRCAPRTPKPESDRPRDASFPRAKRDMTDQTGGSPPS